MTSLSTLATFDDIRRCVHVLCDGTAEEEFLKFARYQDEYRLQWLAAVQEAQRLQRELDTSLQNMANLETKLFHARRLLEMENKARRDAEQDRDRMEKRIVAVAELLQNERDIRDETKDKLAFLNTFSKKRKSLSTHAEEKYGNDINSTGSFLSDLSLTQSEDDCLDTRASKTWRKHRPSLPKNSDVYMGAKKSRLSTEDRRPDVPRRSTRYSNKHRQSGVCDTICSTTTVTVPKNGECTVRAEAIIPHVVVNDENTQRLVFSPPPPTRMSLNVFQPSAPVLEERNKFNSPAPMRSMIRPHNFVSRTFIMTDTCTHCQKKIRFGSVALKCRDCHVCCHTDCSMNLAITCVPQTGTPSMKGLMGVITDYAPNISPMIPALIVHCVNEIETRGLTEVGIYRVSGAEREVKALKERFLRNKGTPHLGSIDVHVLCGCIKDFLRSLREPLIPTNLWKNFSNAVQNPNSQENIQSDLFRAIDNLPQANRDTLSFLILHFQRVAECVEIKMPLENIARVFGPTIVGYSTPDPDQHAIFTETTIQYTVMQNLMKIPTEYWSRFVALEMERQPTAQSKLQKTPSRAKDTLYSLYATPFKGTLKKRKFYPTPPHSSKK